MVLADQLVLWVGRVHLDSEETRGLKGKREPLERKVWISQYILTIRQFTHNNTLNISN